MLVSCASPWACATPFAWLNPTKERDNSNVSMRHKNFLFLLVCLFCLGPLPRHHPSFIHVCRGRTKTCNPRRRIAGTEPSRDVVLWPWRSCRGCSFRQKLLPPAAFQESELLSSPLLSAHPSRLFCTSLNLEEGGGGDGCFCASKKNEKQDTISIQPCGKEGQ